MERMSFKRAAIFVALVMGMAFGGVQAAAPAADSDATGRPSCSSVPCPPPKFR